MRPTCASSSVIRPPLSPSLLPFVVGIKDYTEEMSLAFANLASGVLISRVSVPRETARVLLFTWDEVQNCPPLSR